MSSAGRRSSPASHQYYLLPLAELKPDDPDSGLYHHNAAHDLGGWLRGLPKQEEKATWER
ncbi:hypothetical protein ACF07Y_46225 [Streptomyces sp. NPDC016566]|uniref:hypothetical protein n=1 Tax=Streptomyces sp. NPDC016566 TaxID=3364967 RepID=UPI0036FDB2ED